MITVETQCWLEINSSFPTTFKYVTSTPVTSSDLLIQLSNCCIMLFCCCSNALHDADEKSKTAQFEDSTCFYHHGLDMG